MIFPDLVGVCECEWRVEIGRTRICAVSGHQQPTQSNNHSREDTASSGALRPAREKRSIKGEKLDKMVSWSLTRSPQGFNNNYHERNSSSSSSVDVWGLGCLVWEAFNGPLRARGNLKDLEHIPKSLAPIYCEMVI